jgi:hypothetical protein
MKMTEEEFNVEFNEFLMNENDFFMTENDNLKFEKIGSISQKLHKFKSGKRMDDEILSPEFEKDEDKAEIAMQKKICYAWFLKKDTKYFLLYVGQTSQTFEKRFNSGHRAACRERELSKKNFRFMHILDILDLEADEVQVWVRQSEETTIFGVTGVSLRKVEEDALIKKFNPYLNA